MHERSDLDEFGMLLSWPEINPAASFHLSTVRNTGRKLV